MPVPPPWRMMRANSALGTRRMAAASIMVPVWFRIGAATKAAGSPPRGG